MLILRSGNVVHTPFILQIHQSYFSFKSFATIVHRSPRHRLKKDIINFVVFSEEESYNAVKKTISVHVYQPSVVQLLPKQE